MTGLPTVKVSLDDGTGTFPTDITSKVLMSGGIKFDRGRQDWQGGVTAGGLSLTLDNSDGRFTAGSTFYGSPSPIKVDQRIRFTETINGTTYNRYTGYAKQWPVAWPAVVDTFAVARITATDAQARAERRPLKALIDEEIFADSPSAYYPLGEPAGATGAGDASGNLQPPLTMFGAGTPVAFGSGAAAFTAGGQVLRGSRPTQTITAMECAFSTTASNTSQFVAIEAFGVFGLSSGQVYFQVWPAGAIIFGGSMINDGAKRAASVYYSGGTYFLYVDGTLAGSAAGSAPAAGSIILLGGPNPAIGISISDFAYYTTAPSGSQLSDHGHAEVDGFAGESGTARLTRLAGYAGIPVGTLDTSLTNVPASDTSGRSAWDGIQEAVDAEGGVAFIDGSGNLTFHNRNRVATKASPDLTLDKSYLTAELEPVVDDQQILNYVEASATATGTTQVARSTTSEDAHGRYSDSKSYLVLTDAEALDRGNWIVANFAEPTPRYGTLTLNLYKMAPLVAATVLSAIEVDAWLRIIRMPAQTPGGATADLVVEGYAEELTEVSWTLTLNVVSRSLFNVGILDDAVYGVLDSPLCRFGV